jgi:hypothetical protein
MEELFRFAGLLNILIHFELGNEELAANLIPAARRQGLRSGRRVSGRGAVVSVFTTIDTSARRAPPTKYIHPMARCPRTASRRSCRTTGIQLF